MTTVMQATIVPDDKLVMVDYQPIVFDSPLPILDTIHAIQWKHIDGEAKGEIEWRDKTTPNTIFGLDDYENAVLPFVVLFNNEIARLTAVAETNNNGE